MPRTCLRSSLWSTCGSAGAKGIGHGANYEIVDKEMAYITAAKILATTAIDLLAEGAVLGQKVKDNFKAPMTKEQYLRDWGGLDL